jgi:serine/threonine protein kinase
MAPELLSGGSYGPKVDVYAFGVLLNEMLTRQQPWGAAGAADIRTRVRRWEGSGGVCLFPVGHVSMAVRGSACRVAAG